MRRFAPTSWFLVLTSLTACRAADPGMTSHMLSGRTDATGRSTAGLTSAELSQRRVLVPASAAVPIAEELGRISFELGALQQIGMDVDAPGALLFNPQAGEARWTREAPPPISFGTDALRQDWRTLCQDPLWSHLFPPTPGSGSCDPLEDLDDLGAVLDDMDIRPHFERATFRWDAPQSPVPGCLGFTCFERTLPRGGGPVLVIRVPFDLDPDPIDALGAFVDIRGGEMVVDFRVQVNPCDGACDSGGAVSNRYASGYLGRGPGGDLMVPDVGIELSVTSTLISHDLEIDPAFGCDFVWQAAGPLVIGHIGLGDLAPPGIGTFACSEVVEWLEREHVDPSIAEIGTSIGPLLFASMQPRDLLVTCDRNVPGDCPEAASIAELCAIHDDPRSSHNVALPVCMFLSSRSDAATILNGALRTYDLGDSTADVPLAGGDVRRVALGARFAQGDGLVDALAESIADADTVLSSVALVPGINHIMSCVECSADSTNLESCAYCDFCNECRDDSDELGCRRLCELDAPPLALPTFEAVERRRAGTHPLALPDTLEIWRLVDVLPAMASYVTRIFTRPFEARPGVFVREVQLCPGGSECAAGESGALFLLRLDADRDLADDAIDNCPGIDNPDQRDTDDDGFGDACDLCPRHASEVNERAACDCDVDGDGCNNLPASPELACPSTHGDGHFDEWPSSPSHEDIDGDGRVDDCDRDDDGDGVRDDGAGDGIDVHTPCASGQTTWCDDNCRSVPNNAGLLGDVQRDSDRDGIGNACEGTADPLCARNPALCRSAPSFFDARHLSGLGGVPLPFCARSGGRCIGPAIAGIACGKSSGCSVGKPVVTLLDASGSKRGRVVLEGLGELGVPALRALTFVEIPDLDADGAADWAIGDPRGDAERGRVVIVSSQDGSTLDEIALGDEASAFGNALAHAGGRLYVGAPFARDASGRRVGAVLAIDLGAGVARHAFTAYASEEGAELGRSLATLDEGLGTRVVAGAPGLDAAGRTDSGGALVLDGSGSIVATLAGLSAGDRAGASVAVSATGEAPTIALGAAAADGARGAVLFFAGSGAFRGRLTGTTGGERFGTALATLDLDRDGRDELVVGAPGATGAFVAEGAITVVTPAGKPAARVLGGTAYGEAGTTLSVVERDARSELVVSVPGATLGSVSGAWMMLQPR